jgi:hypothetical protein
MRARHRRPGARTGATCALFLAALLTLPSVLFAGTITGTVRDPEGKPENYVHVVVLGTEPPRVAFTDRTGAYRIDDITPAPVLLKFVRHGFASIVRSVRFEADGTARLDVAFAERVTTPEGLRPWPPTLVESFPDGTSLDSPLGEAAFTWHSLLFTANRFIDLAEFYVSDDPAGRSSLTDIIDLIKEKAAAGVSVRLLVDARFYKTYPGIVDELDRLENVQSRRLDYGDGVLHAKYFIVDRDKAYLGSQNFDWRALEHIQELGALLDDTYAISRLNAVFERDWARGTAVDSSRIEAERPRPRMLRGDEDVIPWAYDDAGDTTRWQFVASPRDDLPEGVEWDLPRLVSMLDAAHDSIEVQLLTYKPKSRAGDAWDELDGALRRAAARGVQVKLLLANWGKRKGTVEHLQELSVVPGFELRFMNIPEAASGFIPFARTVHAKYLVVDGMSFWVGTSNWERDYFYNSRNVGIVGSGGLIAEQLSDFFANGWNSTYAERIRADATYTPPRIAE